MTGHLQVNISDGNRPGSWAFYLMLTNHVELGICKFTPSRKHLGFRGFVALVDAD